MGKGENKNKGKTFRKMRKTNGFAWFEHFQKKMYAIKWGRVLAERYVCGANTISLANLL